MTYECPTCGQALHTPEYVALYECAMLWYPLIALSNQPCEECVRFKEGKVTFAHRQRRRRWLLSSTPLPELDLSDPQVRKGLRKGKQKLKEYRRLVQKQREKRRKLELQREMRKYKRDMKPRLKAIREVLERAAEE